MPHKGHALRPRDGIHAEALKRAGQIGGYLYGSEENGGTATLYVSPVPFEKIDAAIEKGPGRPHMAPVEQRMAKTDSLANSVLLSPAIGLTAGVLAVAFALKGRKNSGSEKEQKP